MLLLSREYFYEFLLWFKFFFTNFFFLNFFSESYCYVISGGRLQDCVGENP